MQWMEDCGLRLDGLPTREQVRWMSRKLKDDVDTQQQVIRKARRDEWEAKILAAHASDKKVVWNFIKEKPVAGLSMFHVDRELTLLEPIEEARFTFRGHNGGGGRKCLSPFGRKVDPCLQVWRSLAATTPSPGGSGYRCDSALAFVGPGTT